MSSNKLSLLVNFVAVDKLSGSLKNIVALGKKGSQSLGALRGEGRKLESQLRAVRKELANSSGNVTALIDRERQLERAIEDTNQQLERRKRLNAIEADRARMAARGEDLKQRGREHVAEGAALAAPLILATAAAAQFSSGMVDIQQKAGLTNEQADRLGRRIVTMARDARQMPEDIRAGLDLLLAKGLGLDAATAAIGPAGRLATAYKVEIPDAADAAFASLNNLKVAAADTARIFDVMAAAGNEGGFEVRDMARHFPALTAQMQALGSKGIPAVADLSAALQVAMNTAGSADEAGNNIVNLLAKINAPGTIRAFKKNFGIDLPAAMKRLTDQGYSAMEAIAMITGKATGGDMKRLGFAFEDRQAQMGLLAIIQNLEEYRRIRAAALTSGGTVDRAFDQRVARDAMVQWNAFKSSVSQLAITLGATLLPVADQVLGMVSAVAGKVAAWAQRNPELAATITKVVAGLIAFKIGLGAVMLVAGSILGPLSTGIALFMKWRALGSLAAVFPKVATGMRMLGLALRFMMGPIGWIITGVGLLAYAVYSNWDTIKAAFNGGVAWVKRLLTGLPDWLKRVGRLMMQGLLLAINPFALGAKLINMAKNGITAFKNYLGIKSPSRLFMSLGRHMTEGLTQGIDRGGRRAVGAMGRVAAGAAAAGSFALTPLAAANAGGPPGDGRPQAGGASPWAGLSLTIHINQQPGESADALADRVVRIIERKAGVAGRRTYEDDA